MKKISIFGATGSIGTSTLEVINKLPKDKFKILGLSAHHNYKKLAECAIKSNAELAVIANEAHYTNLKSLLTGTNIKVAAGASGMQEMCDLDNDLVVAAIVGSAGLVSTYNSIKNGTNIALANKESLVCGGEIIKKACIENKVQLIPVDSEHNAIFQVLEQHNSTAINKILLTASGGPFRQHTKEQLNTVTKEQALNHPNWKMGGKITIDSASLFNKGLELIEAHYLFDMPIEKIEIVVHPESIIHSMVNYQDGSTLAQLANHDMKVPITHALYWPKRYDASTKIVNNLDFTKLTQLNFAKPDYKNFPSLNLCKEAIKIGGTAPIILNASNEIAVELFLNNKIKFMDIFKIVEHMLGIYPHHPINSIEEIVSLDKQFKIQTREFCNTLR
jgi:1-deoxy-D-xylulose-5-phosphate reductoisomerase